MNGKFGDNSIMDKFSTFYNIYNFLIHLALMTTLHAVWKAGYNKVHITQIMLTHRLFLLTYCMTAFVTFGDTTLNTANLCPAISVVGLFYLLTVIMNFVCWSILDVVHSRMSVHVGHMYS